MKTLDEMDQQLLKKAQINGSFQYNNQKYPEGRYPPFKTIVPSLEDMLKQSQKTKEKTISSKLPMFIAGSQNFDKNPLLQPQTTAGSLSYYKDQNFAQNNAMMIEEQIYQRNYDLLNPDNQYLRYRHLLNSQYYNQQANSLAFNQESPFDKTRYLDSFVTSKNSFDIPKQLTLNELQTQQRLNALQNLQKASLELQKPQQLIRNEAQEKQKEMSMPYYSFNQNYIQDNQNKNVNADYYRSLYKCQTVNPDIIQSLGGLQDCIKPFEESFKKHEKRPFDVVPDYYQELQQSRNPINENQNESQNNLVHVNYTSRSEFLKKASESRSTLNNQAIIFSASPYRQILKKTDQSTLYVQQNTQNSKEDQPENDNIHYTNEEQASFNEDNIPYGANQDYQGNLQNQSDMIIQNQYTNQNKQDSYYQEQENDLKDEQNSRFDFNYMIEQKRKKIIEESQQLRNQRDYFLNSFKEQVQFQKSQIYSQFPYKQDNYHAQRSNNINNIHQNQRQVFSGLSEIHNSEIDELKYNLKAFENKFGNAQKQSADLRQQKENFLQNFN